MTSETARQDAERAQERHDEWWAEPDVKALRRELAAVEYPGNDMPVAAAINCGCNHELTDHGKYGCTVRFASGIGCRCGVRGAE